MGFFDWIKSFFLKKPENLYVLQKKEIETYLAADPDSFMRSLDTMNKTARQIHTPSFIAGHFCNINRAEHKRITNATRTVDNMLQKENGSLHEALERWKISYTQLIQIPWVIGVMATNSYERGMSHTRGIVIIIHRKVLASQALESTLLHEKIHVYQKMFPSVIDEVLTKKGYFQKSCAIYQRLNPDTNTSTYHHPKYDVPMYASFKDSSMLQSISDVVFPMNDMSLEHPYEECAYEIQRAYEAFYRNIP